MKQIFAFQRFWPGIFFTCLLTSIGVLAIGGDLDTTFTTGVTGFSNTVKAVAVQADGRVLIAGNFTVVNGRSSNLLARLNADGTIDQNFNAGTGFANNCAGGSLCVDPASNTATINGVTQFSDWTLSELAPTAAAVTLGGRVMTKEGRGIGRAFVTMTAPDGVSRTVITNPFGYFRFTDAAAGETYVISAASKQYVFCPGAHIINAAEDLTDINFFGID